MKNINLKGITAEATTGIVVLLIALVNTVLQIFGINTLPIENENITNIISILLLIVTTLWNTWKNRNISSASQIAQSITDAIKQGELLEKDVITLINNIKNQ